MKSNKKKIVIVLGVLFGLCVISIVAIPFFINVDKYRPEAVALANEKINGKLQIGKMQLSLWGQIKINVDGIELSDLKGNKILTVKNVYFHIPFASLFSGSPFLTLKLFQPEINVVKDKEGKLNALALVKTAKESTSVDSVNKTAPTDAAKKESAKTEVASEPPSFVKKARFGLEIREANLVYRDERQNLDSKVSDLNFLIKDLSMERASEVEFWASLDTKMAKTLAVSGPIKASAKITPEFKGGEFQMAKIFLTASMDDVQISMPGLFEKKSGVPAHFSSTILATKNSVSFDKMECVFFNAKVEGKAELKDWDQEGTLSLNIKSGEIELKPWNELLPSLKEHELSGSANFNAVANGKMLAPEYSFEANLKDFKAKNPKLKVTPIVKGHIKVVTNRVEDLSFSLEAPGSNLEGKGSIIDFTKPKIDFVITSKGLDLDSFMDLKTAAESKNAKASEAVSEVESNKDKPGTVAASSGSAPTTKEEDLDILLDPLRQNEMAKNATVTIKANLANVKAYDVKMTDVITQMSLKNLNFTVENASLKVWDSEMVAKMSIEMLPKVPAYKFNFDVAHLNIKKAVESRMALFKNTLLGNANFSINGSGQSFTTSKAKKNLVASGNLNIKDATFATIDIVQVVTEGVNKTVSEKIPAAKDKKINASDNTQSKYSSVASDFSISNGQFTAPNFFAKAEPGKGIDIKGSTQVGLLDNALKANWEIIDTYNLTHAKDLSVEQNGVKVEHILTEGNEPFKMPLLIEGTTAEPKVSYTVAFEALSKIALKNIGNALTDRAKQEAQKQLQDAAQKAVKQASPQLQDAVKNLGGKLFGN